MYPKGLLASVEHIDHQSDDFGKRIEALLTMLIEEENGKSDGYRNLDDHPYLKKMETVIFNRLGIRVKFHTNGPAAAIMPFYSNRNHIFLHEFFRGQIHMKDQVKAINAFKDRKGTVNLKTAKVGGIFSEYQHKLYLNIEYLVKVLKCTAGEITAALLHELGHAFSACYYADRTDTTNQVLSSILRKIINPDSKETLEYIYSEMQKVSDTVKKEQIDTILNGPRVIAGLTFFKVMVETVRSQMANDKYSETSFEQLADSFASRFGYGQYLIVTLEKIYQGHPEKSTFVFVMAHLMNVMTLAVYVGMIFIAITGIAGIGSIYLAFLGIFMIYSSGEQFTDYTYDTLKMRYKRLRQDVVDQLKQSNIDKQTTKELLDTIYSLDAVVESTKEFKGIGTRLSNFLFSGNRAAISSIEAQQLMETLASNDLFVAAAEFKQMS